MDPNAPANPLPSTDTVLVVGNPYSGRGANRQRVDRLASALEAHGLAVRTAWDPAERKQLLTDPHLAAWCRCIVSAGGDGSLADVVNDLANGHSHDAFAMPDVPLATLPAGNENLFARQFQFTADPQRLAAAIARGDTCRVDLGVVGSRLFTLMASAGFDADVVHRMARWRAAGPVANALRRVNRLSYAGRILHSAHAYAYPSITLEVDGQRVTGSHAFVFNIPQYGGNLGICRQACCDDAMLDWVLFQRPGLRSLATYGLAVVRKRHLDRPDVIHGQARALRIVSDDGPVPLQADGDPAGWTPSAIDIRPAALRVICA
ncbi:MAG: diacylglycerol kinase family protein [Phycisphaeraceae bacterium]